MDVRLVHSERANLLGFFLRDLFQARLVSERNQGVAAKLNARILFEAGGMRAIITCSDTGVDISAAPDDGYNCKVSGNLDTLLNVALGADFLVPLLTRRLRIGGNMPKLVTLLRLLRSDRT